MIMSRNNHPLAVGTQPIYGKHNLSHRHLTTLDVGRIQVMTLQDCTTNDQLSCDLKQVVTTAPNISPLQGKFIMHTAAFYVRNRVVMKDWTAYRTGMKNVNIPHFDLNNAVTEYASTNERIAHLGSFGISTNASYLTKDSANGKHRGLNASLLPFRCYRRIWWDWFRNSMVIPDTQESSYLFTDNGNESILQYVDPHYCNWDKDFMSNFLRTPAGDSRVTACNASAVSILERKGSSTPSANSYVGPRNVDITAPTTKTASTTIDPNINIPVQGYSATDNSINALRASLGLQAVIEKMSALGGRLKDRLKGMFGSSVSYEVLGMSELLGYNEFEVNFDNESSPLTTTNEDSDINAFGSSDVLDGTVKGQLTGKSTMTENGLSNVNYHCTEDGYFIILSWLTPDAMLSCGLDAHWFRGIDGLAPSRFDFLTDEFVGKGFDPVNAVEVIDAPIELSNLGNGTYDPFKAIGFNAKYHNYTYHHDVVSGDFKNPRVSSSMKNWYLQRNLLQEQGVVDINGALVTGKTGDDVNNAVNFDNCQGLNARTRVAYDSNFLYTASDFDHFIVQNKCELVMTRRLPSAPRVDMLTQSPVETGIGGTRL